MVISATELAQALNGKKEGKGWVACCPAHDDKSPSLAIDEGSDGKVLVHCRAGCEQAKVIEALDARGLWYRAPDTLPGRKGNHHKREMKFAGPVESKPSPQAMRDDKLGAPVESYEYTDQDGKVIGYIRRFSTIESKTYRPLTPWKDDNGRIAWLSKAFPKPYPLYNAADLTEGNGVWVLVVEGEKAAEAAKEIFPDFVAATWPGGAKGASHANWELLRGRQVVIWPDADEVGKDAGQRIQSALSKIASRVVLVSLPDGLPKGWDLADDIPIGFDPTGLLRKSIEPDRGLAGFIISAPEMANLKIAEREYIVEPFIPADSLSMIYATRGIGKTWFALSLAVAVARGSKFLHYEVPEARRVLYIDGEMTLADLKSRISSLDNAETDNLQILPSEPMFREAEPLNINDPNTQARILTTLSALESENKRPALIILDNLSSLGGGIDENDNTALESQLRWLLKLRHMRYAILLIHHAGKSGDQRGASRREDLLDTSIKLERPKLKPGEELPHGAHFNVEFVKVRGKLPKPRELRLELAENAFGKLDWGINEAAEARPEVQTLRRVLEGDISSGRVEPYQRQGDIGKDLSVAKSTISKHMKVLKEAKLVNVADGLGIQVTFKGLEALGRNYSDVEKFQNGPTVFFGHQDDLPI